MLARRRSVLAAFGLAATLIAAIEVAAIVDGPLAWPGTHALFPLVGLAYCFAGPVGGGPNGGASRATSTTASPRGCCCSRSE